MRVTEIFVGADGFGLGVSMEGFLRPGSSNGIAGIATRFARTEAAGRP
jgi:hypothetical protein